MRQFVHMRLLFKRQYIKCSGAIIARQFGGMRWFAKTLPRKTMHIMRHIEQAVSPHGQTPTDETDGIPTPTRGPNPHSPRKDTVQSIQPVQPPPAVIFPSSSTLRLIPIISSMSCFRRGHDHSGGGIGPQPVQVLHRGDGRGQGVRAAGRGRSAHEPSRPR